MQEESLEPELKDAAPSSRWLFRNFRWLRLFADLFHILSRGSVAFNGNRTVDIEGLKPPKLLEKNHRNRLLRCTSFCR